MGNNKMEQWKWKTIALSVLILLQSIGFGSCYLKDYIHKQEDNEMRGEWGFVLILWTGQRAVHQFKSISEVKIEKKTWSG